MASGSISFLLYKDDFDVIMVVTETDILQNDEKLNSEINSCIKKCHHRKNQASNVNIVIKFQAAV